MTHPYKLITVTDDEFRDISQLVYSKFGIHLTEKKRNLVNGRLQKLLRKYQFSNFREYINYLKSEQNSKLYSELVDQISTNHTFFFREYQHFQFMMKYALPEFEAYRLKQNKKSLRVWCAAASSGEEPYTIAMHMLEYFGARYKEWNAGLLATDISEEILEKAQKGVYTLEQVNKVPPNLQKKYFTKEEGAFAVTPALKNEVLFRKFNLISPNFPFKGDFDLISCRNVMIYFDRQTRETLVNKLYKQLRPGGYLFVGHSETLNGLNTPFTFVESAIYRRDS